MGRVRFFVFIFLILFLTSCGPMVRYATKTEVKKVPYEETETYMEVKEVEKTIKIDGYKIAPPYFPLQKDVLKIAVLPFTHSTALHNKGIEVSEEIEFELIKRAERYESSDVNQLLSEIYEYINDDYCGIEESDILSWINNNKQKKYEIINRTLISDVLSENEIQNLSTSSIEKAKKILGVDALITGHVRSSDGLSFIMKAIDTKTSKVVFSERYSGSYLEAIKMAVDAFYFNIVKVPNICSKTIVEKVATPKTRTITKYREQEVTKKVQECYDCIEYSSKGCKQMGWVPCNEYKGLGDVGLY